MFSNIQEVIIGFEYSSFSDCLASHFIRRWSSQC